MVLDSRLMSVYNLIRDNAKVADIGTDHALLPAYLILNKKAKLAYACDINEGPLLSARETVEHFHLEDKIKLVLSNGLDKITADMADDIVIAGMGGTLIADIIKRALWLQDKSKHLILQPMTKDDFLRQFLLENGFTIDKEVACTAKGKCYSIMSVYFCGEKKTYDEVFLQVGELPQNLNEDSKNYISSKAFKVKKIADGYVKKGDLVAFNKYIELYNKLASFLED